MGEVTSYTKAALDILLSGVGSVTQNTADGMRIPIRDAAGLIKGYIGYSGFEGAMVIWSGTDSQFTPINSGGYSNPYVEFYDNEISFWGSASAAAQIQIKAEVIRAMVNYRGLKVQGGLVSLVNTNAIGITGNDTPTTISGLADILVSLGVISSHNLVNVETAVTNLINSSPATLDTLNELAAALGNDPNFATTIVTALGQKASGSKFTYEPQTLVLDTVYTYYELTVESTNWFQDPPAQLDQIISDTNRALPRGEVGWIVGTQADNGNDGIYVVTSLGSSTTPWVLTRHSNYNTVAELHKFMVFLVGKNPDGNNGLAFLTVDWSAVQSLDPTQYPYAINILHLENSFGHVEGLYTRATGYGAHAEGDLAVASGNYAHAEGDGNKAESYASHAEGAKTIADAYYAHAEGSTTRAHGQASHAEGRGSVADGFVSHAEGYYAHAEGAFSHAEGGGTWSDGSIYGTGHKQYVSTQISIGTLGNGVPVALQADSSLGEVPVHANRTYCVRAMVAAHDYYDEVGAAWLITAAVRTNASKVPTIIGTPTVTLLGADSAASTWVVVFSVSTGFLRILVSGTSPNNILWSAKLETQEIGHD